MKAKVLMGSGFTLRGWFKLLLLLVSLFAFSLDTIFGILYSANAAVLAFFSSRFGEKGKVLFLISLSVFSFYLVRPLFLWSNPDSYVYQNLGVVTQHNHYWALSETLFLSLSGLLVFFVVSGNGEKNRSQKGHSLWSGRMLLGIAMMTIVAFEFFIGNRFGGMTNYIRILSPSGLLQTSLVVLVVGYSRFLRSGEKIFFILLLVIALLISVSSGSKGAVLGLCFTILSVYVLRSGDEEKQSISIRSILGLTSLLVIALALYGVAWVLRSTDLTGWVVYSQIFITHFLQADGLAFFFDRLTVRLNGYDGLIAAKMLANSGIPVENVESLNWINALKGAVGKLIPNVQYGPDLSFGRNVAINIRGLPNTTEHAGAIGLFGMFRVSSFGEALCSTLMFFSLSGVLFRVATISSVTKINSLFIIALLVNWVAMSINSGNLDNMLNSLMVKIITLVGYGILLYIITHVCRRQSLTGRV